jgi:hypothetical protein
LQIFSEIPEMGLKNVFTDWITRLSWWWRKVANTRPNN